MFQNILFPRSKVEHPGPTYYLPPANIYGLGINDDSNNICSIYTWTEFEVKKGMENIASCLLCYINDKGYYYQSYGKNNKIPKIDILVNKCSGQNKNNIMIWFLIIIKKGGFFGTSNFHLYIKFHTRNDSDRVFNGLKVLYQKKNVFTFEKCCGILNTRKNVEVIQMFHEKFFYLG